MADFKSSVKSIAKDLLHIEVNTIVSSGLTARKMPAPPDAMLDIAEKYQRLLSGTAADVGAGLGEGDGFLGDDEKRAGRILLSAEESTFFKLRKWGSKVLAADRGVLSEETRIVIDRIRRNSGRIERIFAALAERGYSAEPGTMTRDDLKDAAKLSAMKLLPDEMTALRKIWEVGTERVLMQSVIQIDGDAMTRIRAGRETENDKTLHLMHGETVKTSLEYWQFLVKTLTNFVSSTIASLWGGLFKP
jgi:hypothetical protein